MIACLDVGYREDDATAACVLIEDWKSESSLLECTETITDIQEYVPGQFYQRELPCLMTILAAIDARPDVIIVDGFVTLDPAGKLGLGGHLHREINRPGRDRTDVIGVAKTGFREATHAIPVLRGESDRPLLVTAAGMDDDEAAALIASMAGPHRIPTMLKRVDWLSRVDG